MEESKRETKAEKELREMNREERESGGKQEESREGERGRR